MDPKPPVPAPHDAIDVHIRDVGEGDKLALMAMA
jgi:hypothetical protein